MKLMHISDIHLGKRVYDFSMIKDQEYILERILDICDEERPDAVLIAGDVYDRSMPSTEAVNLFDDFMYELASRELEVFVISGNHDSAERLAVNSRLIKKSGVHIARAYDGKIEAVPLNDEYGEVIVYMLPFIKPVNVKQFFPEADINSYEDAVMQAISEADVDETKRNVIIAHQFVTGAKRSESEEIAVGGLDNISADCFDAFDYAALGHIHGPQNLGERVRYSGTPLKYSFSEVDHNKSVSMAELGAKGDLDIRTISLVPLHDMRIIKGKFDELTDKNYYSKQTRDDYLKVVLTDETDVLEAFARLSDIYPNLMNLEYDNTRTRSTADFEEIALSDMRTPLDVMSELFTQQNGRAMTEDEEDYCRMIIEEIWSEEA